MEGMALLPYPLPDLETDLNHWRRRTMDIVLWTIFTVRLVHMGFFLGQLHREGIPMGAYQLGTLAPILLLLLLALARRLPVQVRGWGFIGLAYLNLGFLFLQTNRLDGQLPLGLLTAPVFAVVLLGRRSAWVAAGISTAFYGSFAALRHFNLVPPVQVSLASSGALQTWVVWAVLFAPMFVLLDLFTARFQRLLVSERRNHLRLQEEAEERLFLEKALLETSERERQAVGHELHDGVCQQITGAMLHCKALERDAVAGAVPQARSVRAISAMLDASLGQVHDLARGLSPGTITAEALLPSLRDLARRTQETFEVDCLVEADEGVGHLDPVVATHLYRIAQEAMVNAVKHGEPTCIALRLRQEAEHLLLEVHNDGGFVAGSTREGMGLRIMRHRSDLIGGDFSLDLAAGDIRVRCAVPLPVPVPP